MTVGSDNFADAPVIPLGTSSEWTPNAGYTTEPGEPVAEVGRTAWWRLSFPAFDSYYVDALYSRIAATGAVASSRVWIYRASEPSSLANLALIADPGVNARAEFAADPSRFTYFARVDTPDAAPVSYCLAVGGETYDEIRVRAPLGGEAFDPGHMQHGHFSPAPRMSGPPADAYYAAAAANSGLIGGATALDSEATDSYAWIDAEGFATDGSAFIGGEIPNLAVLGTSYGRGSVNPVTFPPGDYDLARVRFVFIARVTAPPQTIPVNPSDGSVNFSTLAGEFRSGAPRHLDDSNTIIPGDLVFSSEWQEHRFAPPVGYAALTVLNDYNNDALTGGVRPTTSSDTPIGAWHFAYMGIEFIFEKLVDYVPPPPPPWAVVAVVRLYPRDDGRGLSSAARIHPPSPARRIVGGYQ